MNRDDTLRKTRFTFEAPKWWIDAAFARTRAQGSQRTLIASLKERFGIDYDKAEVSRCCKGKRVAVDLAQNISTVLGIELPIYIPLTPEESQRMGQQRELTVARQRAEPYLTRVVDPKIAALKAEVAAEVSAGVTYDQKRTVGSPDDIPMSQWSERVGRNRPSAKRGKPRTI